MSRLTPDVIVPFEVWWDDIPLGRYDDLDEARATLVAAAEAAGFDVSQIVKKHGNLAPPVTYQGGKVRLAPHIVVAMGIPFNGRFYDLCCGSGAVAVAAVNAGHPPDRITMLDASPWGLFWRSIGDGTFDALHFAYRCAQVPSDLREIKPYLEGIYRQTAAGEQVVYDFLLLQAGALGGKAIWIEDGRWRNGGFRDYWLPTETSNRRSPVNPMMPMPATIAQRAAALAVGMRGVRGLHVDVGAFTPNSPGRAYIDPPYEGTATYGYAIDAAAVADRLRMPCWVSEGKALSNDAIMLSAGRSKGGITGNRKKAPNAEWLSAFNRGLPT